MKNTKTKTTNAMKNGRNQLKNTASNAKLPPQGKQEVCKVPERVDIVDPKHLTIPAEFVDEVLFWGPAGPNQEGDALIHVRSAMLTAKTLKENLVKGKYELEALKKMGALMNHGMTSKGFLFWEGACDYSKDLFPESYALVRRLEATLEQEIQRLNTALHAYIVIRALRDKSCAYTGLTTGLSTRPVPVLALVQETGLSLDTIVTIVNDLRDVIHQKQEVDDCVSPEVKRRFAELFDTSLA